MLTLRIFPETLAICRLPADQPLPDWVRGDFVSVTRTPHELSIVCSAPPEGVQAEHGWRALAVEGPLAFDLVGVIAGISAALAQAGLSIFVVSTYDTDYVLVKNLDAATAALSAAGYMYIPPLTSST